MKLAARKHFLRPFAPFCGYQLTPLLCFGLLLWASVSAQTPANRLARVRALSTNSLPPLPESATLPAKSPVALFRDLLAMNPAERNKYLADRPPENRKLILGKVREYLSLKPSERELRLKVTELRWYLWPLMKMPATNRPPLLERIPAEDRQFVESRLQEWDKLSPDVQKELLENEATIRYFTEQQQTNPPVTISAARQKWLEQGVQQWQKLPEAQRQKMVARFNLFFALTPQEKVKILGTLSEAERRQIDKTLRQFDRLPSLQRAQCVRSFEKFAGLSLVERQQFLKNAERWKLMSPDERQAWKELVEKSTLLPPSSFGQVTAPMPPLPGPVVPRSPRASPAVATNRN